MTDKKIVAVIFGGRSVEHDVSVLTGLQFLEALNPTLYEGLPIYVDPLGAWWTGEALTRRSHYPVTDDKQKALIPVQLDLATPANGSPRLVTQEKGMLGSKQGFIDFDIMVPAIHGSNGEDGTLQGMLDFAAI
ncbi:MAG: D-alanine--D-alanine ligase, partial [Spirochaetes bacterium]|nr:D-alanine--D-alanine ligase [Spirochaetota bacterium]